MKIKKAILPVAGFGTRFLPATKAQPKEMLPVFDTPAIQYIVQEAVDAGIEEIIFVTGRGKQAIENHFDSNFELEHTLQEKGKTQILEDIRKTSTMANFAYVRQPQPLGDGHAILCAKGLLEPGEAVVVLFGDDLVDNEGGKNAVEQLLQAHQETQKSVILLEEVPKEETKKYGIVACEKQKNNQVKITNFVEKPNPDEAPSNLGVIGKFVLTYELLETLEKSGPCQDGEIRLANAFMEELEQEKELYGKVLQGKRFDTGDKLGFLKATLHYALKKENEGVANALRDFLFKP